MNHCFPLDNVGIPSPNPYLLLCHDRPAGWLEQGDLSHQGIRVFLSLVDLLMPPLASMTHIPLPSPLSAQPSPLFNRTLLPVSLFIGQSEAMLYRPVTETFTISIKIHNSSICCMSPTSLCCCICRRHKNTRLLASL